MDRDRTSVIDAAIDILDWLVLACRQEV